MNEYTKKVWTVTLAIIVTALVFVTLVGAYQNRPHFLSILIH